MALSQQTRIDYLTDLIPATGTYGVAVLIDNLTPSRAIASINTTTDEITLSSNTWVTQTRVRISTVGTLPTTNPQISPGIDYFLNRINSETFTLHLTRADAVGAANAIDFISAGTDNTLTEQLLTVDDPLSVLINHEVSHGNYARYTLSDMGSPTGPDAVLPAKTLTVEATSGNGTLTFRHLLILEGGETTLGSTVCDRPGAFLTNSAAVAITEGNLRVISLTLKLPSA